MKRLLVAAAAAVAVSTAFARVTETELFEDNSYTNVFAAAGQEEDSSAIVQYDNDKPGFAQPYPCDDNFGNAYLSLDTGSDALWCTNTVEGNVYFDMAMQFNPSKTAPDVETGTKVALYMNSDSNLVVVAGDGTENRGKTEYPVTGTMLAPGTWGRLTLSAVNDGGLVFKVYLNGTQLYSGATGTFQCLTTDTTVSQFGLAGSGAIDDFVVRTTDPFLNSTVKIGGEYYASVDAALADDPTATVEITADAVTSKVLANAGDSISVKLNGHALTGLTAAGSLVPVSSVSGDVTTYTASYFPRTATAGQDGTASNPYEIADADDLLALQAAVLADASWRSLCYKQTADIDMTGVGGFYGIGWFKSSVYASLPAGVVATDNVKFSGVFDGNGMTIANVEVVTHSYAGIFNCIEGATIKGLTVSNATFNGTCSEEGFAVVGNAYTGSTVANVTSVGTWPTEMRHNTAGIAVRVEGDTIITGCVNRVAISTSSKRLGGIVAFTGTSGPVNIVDCKNYAALVSTDGSRGVGGILGCPESGSTEASTIIRGCVDFGSEAAQAPEDKGNAGAIVGSNWNGAYTYTDGGGNTFKASTVDCGYVKNAVFGRAYAIASTIDAVDYLTTVKQSDLAAGNTYTLLANVAASETPVYTFDAAGTISFNTNGFEFAGTVASDRTILLDPAATTVDDVITYTTAAGVASVDDLAYATFEGAVEAIEEGGTTDDFVTLLADATPTLSAGTTLKVKMNGHQFAPNKATEDVVISMSTLDGVTTVTSLEGMAKCNDTWYLTFAEAYAAANASGTYPKLEVKIDGDFNPSLPNTIKDFHTIRFTTTSEDPIVINLKDAESSYYMASTRYYFPANATLVLAADYQAAQDNVSSGTLEIPENIKVTMTSYLALQNLSAVVGAGTIEPTAAACDYLLDTTSVGNVLPTSLRASTWTGTLVLSGTHNVGTWSLGNYGNSNSKICFNGLTTYLNSGSHNVGAVELLGDGLTINGNYSSGTWTFPGALTGSGALNVSIEDTAGGKNLKLVEFTGVTSDFAGSISFGADATNACVVFGSTGIDGTDKAAKRIVTGDDAVVAVASGKTWTADEFMLHGTVTVSGTLLDLDGTTLGSVWNNHSSAVLTANAANAFKFGNYTSWTGRYVVNYDNAADSDKFVIPTHANATTVINGVDDGFKGYPTTGSAAPTVYGSIVLNADWTVGNGWTDQTTTFASLSGAGDFTVNGNGSGNTIPYAITTLDGYTGTLGGNRGGFTIGKVNVAEAPADGARVVKTAIGANGSINNNVPLWVNGADSGKTLTYDASGAQGAGLYYIVPVARIEGGDSYPTLGAAVAAAAASGDTIALLDNITLDERITLSKSLTLNLGGYAITRTAAPNGDNGSAFRVDGNYAVVITNGTIDCSQVDDSAVVGDGVYAIDVKNGGSLTLDSLTIAVNSQAGACVYPWTGSSVTILGGTYRNDTADVYQYGRFNAAGLRGMAVNQANVATQLITIYGGSFKQVNPALGDDSWAEGEGTFLASGKAATYNSSTCYWDVGDAATPVEPGQKDSTKYDTAEAATNAAATVTIAIPSAVDSALDAGQKADYVAMFEKKVVDNGDGTFSVAVEMKDEVVAEVQEDVDDAKVDTLTEVLKVAAGASTDVTVATKPGLYYAIVVGNSLPLAAPTSSDYVMATADSTAISVTKPSGNAAFFKVYCSETK